MAKLNTTVGRKIEGNDGFVSLNTKAAKKPIFAVAKEYKQSGNVHLAWILTPEVICNTRNHSHLQGTLDH